MSKSICIRGQDRHGAGYFGAPRGKRTHNGVDIVCRAGDAVTAFCDGTVTKLGYPYSPQDPKKGHLRYVEVTDIEGNRCRYFYVKRSVSMGDRVRRGDLLGVAQGLTEIYKGITDHYHFEIKLPAPSKKFIYPTPWLMNHNCNVT